MTLTAKLPMVQESDRLGVLHDVLVSALETVGEPAAIALYESHRRRMRYDKLAQTQHLPEPLLEAVSQPVTGAALMAALDTAFTSIRRIPAVSALLTHQEVGFAPSAEALVDAWTYGLLLDRVTAACTTSPESLEAVWRHLRRQRQGRRWYRHNRYFLTLKLLSLLPPVRHISRIANGKARPMPRALWAMMALNVIEACATDWLAGRRANARAGLALLRSPYMGVHGRGYTPPVGCDEARAWADQYTAWNLRFVSRFPAFLKVAVVLLLPSTLAYVEDPASFVHRRSIALFQHVHFAVFCYADGDRLSQEPGAPEALQSALHTFQPLKMRAQMERT